MALAVMLFLSPLAAVGQTLTGTVVDGKGQPLPGVSVMMKGAKGKVLAYAITAERGTFALKMPGETGQGDSIEFKSMGYARVALPVSGYRNGCKVTMAEEAFRLKEVKVKPPKISLRGDTLNYLVGSFRRGSDRSIADVIARMPGLEVNADGGITYQGKSINKFYIEGMDLMGGKYATASENLDARKVKTVQVLERHQPVRALQDVAFSDQAALNIVLEDSVRDVWQGELTLAGGATVQGNADALYDSRALAMLFSRKMQSVSMYKCNNTGKDIAREVCPLASPDEFVPTEGGMLSNIGMAGTGLKENRTTFNDTHILATNWLLRTPGGNDLRMQLTGLFDKTRQRQQTVTAYTNIGGDAVVTEDNDARSYNSELDGELMYKINKDSLYLVNTLTGFAGFDHSAGTALLNGEATRQKVRPRRWYVTDNLRFIRNLSGGRSLTASSALAYTALPGTLLLHDGTTERLDISTLTWNASTAFGHRLWRMHVDYTAGLDLKRQRLDVGNTLNAATDSYDEYRVYVTPSVSYPGRKVRFGVNVPLSWRLRRLNGLHRGVLTVEPGAYVSVKPTARWDVFANYMYSWNPQDALTSGAAAVFTDYRTVHQGSGRLENTMAHMASMSANYKDVIHGLFANGGVSYANSLNNIMYSAALKDNVYYTTPTERLTDTHSLTVRAAAGKSFDWAGLMVKLSARKSWSYYDMLVGDDVRPYRTESADVRLDVSVRPADVLSFDLSSSYNESRQAPRTQGDAPGAAMRYFYHSLKAYLMPGRWLVEWSNELYHSNDKSVTPSFFSDLSVAYKTRTFEVGLDLNNIFGRRTFERRYFTDTQRMVSVSRLRPRELVVRFKIGI